MVDRFAEPGDTASPGQKLLSLYNPVSLRVEARVREQLALKLAIGDELTVEVPALAQRYTARIEEIVPADQRGVTGQDQDVSAELTEMLERDADRDADFCFVDVPHQGHATV